MFGLEEGAPGQAGTEAAPGPSSLPISLPDEAALGVEQPEQWDAEA